MDPGANPRQYVYCEWRNQLQTEGLSRRNERPLDTAQQMSKKCEIEGVKRTCHLEIKVSTLLCLVGVVGRTIIMEPGLG